MMARRVIAFALLAFMVLVPLGVTSAQVRPFRDVPQDHWALDAIERLRQVNLVEGYPDGTFGGDRTFTRYEMAMVFARTLARLEQLIDDRIAGHVGDLRSDIDALKAQREQDLAALMAAIEAARKGLADELGSRIDGLEDELNRLRADLSAVAAEVGVTLEPSAAPSGEPGAAAGPGAVTLTPAARAAIEEQVAREVERAVAELPDRAEVVERLTEVIRERDRGLSAEELEALVEKAIAERLRDFGADEDVAARAAAGDPEAVREALAQIREQAAADVEHLAVEFGDELEMLGARVSDLETLFDSLEERVARLEDELADTRREVASTRQDFEEWKRDRRTKFSGGVGVEVDVAGLTQGTEEFDNRYGGVRAFLRDPRNKDRGEGDRRYVSDDDVIFDRSRIRQRFNLKAETEPSEGVDLTAELSVINDSTNRVRARLDSGSVVDDRIEGFSVDALRVLLTSESSTGQLYYGLLDEEDVTAEGFNPYILDYERFVEPDPARENHRGTVLAGAFANANIRGRIVTVNRANIEFDAPRHDPRGNRDDEDRRDFATAPGRRYAASIGANLGQTWNIHGGWAAHEHNGSDALLSAGVNGPITRHLRAYALGARDTRTEANAFEVGLDAVLGSVDLGLSYGDVGKNYGWDPVSDEHRSTFLGSDSLSHNHSWWLADANTPFLGGNLRGRYYHATAKDGSVADVDENRVARADYSVDVDWAIPFRLEAAFASGKEDPDADSKSHTMARLSWENHPIFANKVFWDVRAEFIGGWEIKKDRHWNEVDRWEQKDKTTVDTTLTWRPWEPVGIYGGYKHVNTDRSKDAGFGKYNKQSEDIVTAGIDYAIPFSRYTTVTVGYELQKADVKWDGVKQDRTDRNTIKAAIEQAIAGGGTLRLEGKRIEGAGGDGADKNNAVDWVASARVLFPVARNVSLDLSGHYVDSRGNILDPDGDGSNAGIDDYTVTEVRAGLALQF